MQLELTDEETRALLNLLIDAIEGDRYPMSPRILLLRNPHQVRRGGPGCRRNSRRNSAAMPHHRQRDGQHQRSATRAGPRGRDGDCGKGSQAGVFRQPTRSGLHPVKNADIMRTIFQ
jgi:hypothetical protein